MLQPIELFLITSGIPCVIAFIAGSIVGGIIGCNVALNYLGEIDARMSFDDEGNKNP